MFPIWCPSRRTQNVSTIGVKVWYSANQRTPAGIELVGKKELTKNGRNLIRRGVLLADSGVLDARPMATASQVSANVSMLSRPSAASHSTGPAVDQNPMIHSTPMTIPVVSLIWIILSTTAPLSK